MSSLMKQVGFAIFTFAVYTAVFSWKVALMLTVGVGFHEYSHLLAAKQMGLNTRGFYLFPFVGGVALVADRYKRYSQQAFVVLAGPVGGGLLALATAGAWYVTQSPFLAAAALWMSWLNLFNLLPLSFMDGGQLLETISYSVNRTLGMVLKVISNVVALIVLWHLSKVIFSLVLFFGGSSVITEVTNWYYYRQGKTFLCTEGYLNPPKRMTVGQMLLTVLGWATTSITLVYLSKFLINNSGSDLVNLLK